MEFCQITPVFSPFILGVTTSDPTTFTFMVFDQWSYPERIIFYLVIHLSSSGLSGIPFLSQPSHFLTRHCSGTTGRGWVVWMHRVKVFCSRTQQWWPASGGFKPQTLYSATQSLNHLSLNYWAECNGLNFLPVFGIILVNAVQTMYVVVVEISNLISWESLKQLLLFDSPVFIFFIVWLRGLEYSEIWQLCILPLCVFCPR